ncbi:hypothetical protein cypCar_00034481 [Cyprinus carpio]|nr:hypothetical protein cypCar_00034481 [Cyprinus carpio]
MVLLPQESIPFAVIGSNTVVEAKGKRVRGRLYPWGIVEVENPAHCDFVKLRNMLVRTHMQDLKDVTRETHYENYRAHCIQSMTRMVVKERNRNKLTRESGTDFPIPMVPGVTDTETEKLIREKDEEIHDEVRSSRPRCFAGREFLGQSVDNLHGYFQNGFQAITPIGGQVLEATKDTREKLVKDVEELRTKIEPMRAELRQVLEKHFQEYRDELKPFVEEYLTKHQKFLEEMRTKLEPVVKSLREKIGTNWEETKSKLMPILRGCAREGGGASPGPEETAGALHAGL